MEIFTWFWSDGMELILEDIGGKAMIRAWVNRRAEVGGIVSRVA